MRFRVDSITRCQGRGHFHITVTAEGKTRTFTISRDEVQAVRADIDTMKERVIERLISEVQHSGASTFAQVQTALVGKELTV